MDYYEIGCKVIAIRNHPEMVYKSGQIYTLCNMRKSLCACTDPLLDIGLKNKYHYWVCDICNCNGRVADSIFWVSSVDFMPYDDGLSETTYEDIMQQIEELAQ